jgi:uncharacterized paraquat-inducible protein A
MPPSKYNWMRISALLLGIAILIWLSFEDSDIRILLAFSSAVCLWTGIRLLYSGSSGRTGSLIFLVMIGFVVGFAVVPVAVTLMAIKSGLHAHSTAEYTGKQVQDVLVLAPVLSISGLLLGLGAGLLRIAQRGD